MARCARHLTHECGSWLRRFWRRRRFLVGIVYKESTLERRLETQFVWFRFECGGPSPPVLKCGAERLEQGIVRVQPAKRFRHAPSKFATCHGTSSFRRRRVT